MTDLNRKELEDFRAYGATFLGSKTGQRVLADLIESFMFIKIMDPNTQHNVAILQGERNVIRYILGKLGFGEQTEKFVQALAISIPKAPEPFDQTEAETE
ncbi:hypothetical protein LCGC14_1257840 [marine sediment metagenome]|uniref:Uncharacterized protein n=1 Tax=marine sediment metagenome TaxID=412755 RepID=A0A0F9NI81_9ZZZZ|nr:hypothetical protein [Candidatus Aminicenantes bacterium]